MSFSGSYGRTPVVDLIVSESAVSQGMAHAMVLSAQRDWHLATCAEWTSQFVR